MDPARNLENPDNQTQVPVYRGEDLIRRLKSARGVAFYSGHKITPTKKAIQKMANSIAERKAMAEESGMDTDKVKKMALIGVVFIALIYFIL